MNSNILPSDKIALLGAIDPDAMAPGTVSTPWIPFQDYVNAMFVIMLGQLGSGATVSAKLEQAQDATGTGAKDIEGKAIADMTQGGTNQSDSQAIINCRADALDVTERYTHFRLSLTVAGAASDVAALVLATDCRQDPVPTGTTIDQIV